jgi:hypothetical protein
MTITDERLREILELSNSAPAPMISGGYSDNRLLATETAAIVTELIAARAEIERITSCPGCREVCDCGLVRK